MTIIFLFCFLFAVCGVEAFAGHAHTGFISYKLKQKKLREFTNLISLTGRSEISAFQRRREYNAEGKTGLQIDDPPSGTEIKAAVVFQQGTSGIIEAVSNFADFYNSLLEKNPLMTKIISATLTCVIGDVLSQMIDLSRMGKSILQLDYRRMALFSLCGGIYYSPLVNIWLEMLDKLPLPRSFNNWQRTFSKLFVDQTVGVFTMNPLFFLGFEVINRMLPPYTPQSVNVLQAFVQSLQAKLLVTVRTNYFCWPMISFLNLSFVPPRYRLLFVNIAAVFWNIFMSSIASIE